MYIHPDARLNGFKKVKIPTNSELFAQLGPKAPNDKSGSNGDEWINPDPVAVDNLDMIAAAERDLSAEAIQHQRALSDADRAIKADEQKQEEQPATS